GGAQIPQIIDAQPEDDDDPPERQFGSHPGPVTVKTESRRQDLGCRNEHDIEPQEFGYRAQPGVNKRDKIIGFAQTMRNLRIYLSVKRWRHHQKDHNEIKKHYR